MPYLGGAAGWIHGSAFGAKAVQREAAASPLGEGDELRKVLCAGEAFTNPSARTGVISPKVGLSTVS